MTETALRNGSARTADVILAEHGFTGDRLLKLAHRIAADELRRRGAFLDYERLDDLVAFLALKGVQAALRYDPTRKQVSYGKNGGDPFASWMADILQHRVTDWYRSKAEGHGDARYGNDRRVTVVDQFDDESVPGTEFDFEQLVSERRLLEWQEAARHVDLPVAEWVVVTLDRAAAVLRCN